MVLFPTSLVVSEQLSEWMSAVVYASEASNAEQANMWVVRANNRMDKPVAHASNRRFHSHWPNVARGSRQKREEKRGAQNPPSVLQEWVSFVAVAQHDMVEGRNVVLEVDGWSVGNTGPGPTDLQEFFVSLGTAAQWRVLVSSNRWEKKGLYRCTPYSTFYRILSPPELLANAQSDQKLGCKSSLGWFLLTELKAKQNASDNHFYKRTDTQATGPDFLMSFLSTTLLHVGHMTVPLVKSDSYWGRYPP